MAFNRHIGIANQFKWKIICMHVWSGIQPNTSNGHITVTIYNCNNGVHLNKKKNPIWAQQRIYLEYFTLYDPRSCTTHVRVASRPTGAVTFRMGELNFGSAEMFEKKKLSFKLAVI